ncbi:MAG TPA: class I SAM-dependent methyltransferase [Azospirillaceae bacterium]|nr:class I SAM-dependent methyltransferase [Azospirillaceae bacterium]
MNLDVPDADGTIRYYDSDYPWPEEVADRPDRLETLARTGILQDIRYYEAQVEAVGGPVLDVFCGTGRITIPVARRGVAVTGVDSSAVQLEGLRARLAAEPEAVRARVQAVAGDLAALDLPRRDFRLALWPFNGLMLVPDFDAQMECLRAIARHLVPGGRLALDVANPLVMPLGALATPEVSPDRTNRQTGNTYNKFSMLDAMDASQVQRNRGWYDEILPDGSIRRTPYAFSWRLVFRYELELMLDKAGFRLERLDGGFFGEPFEAGSPKMVAVAERV